LTRRPNTRNDVTGLTAEAIGYENGVLGGVISALNCVCSRGDKVLVHSPTYIGFTRCLTDNGYDIVHSPGAGRKWHLADGLRRHGKAPR
jgi:cystathionine beta-lyase